MSNPIRACTDVGPGDFVKIGSEWKEVASNTAYGEERTPRSWTVRTKDGREYGMFDINRYAKRGDLR